MIDNDSIIEVKQNEISIEAQEDQISTTESITHIVTDGIAPLISSVEEIPVIDIVVGETAGASLETKVVVDHSVSKPNQHTIGAITGLREELDEIKRVKPVYSDKINVANYYKWNNSTYDSHGNFVSLVNGGSSIEICSGSNILGVTVDGAGFIGGQDGSNPRDLSYGLIATSGTVDVLCELDVEVGDCVTSNTRGYATKSGSDYGYKVLARENKNGSEYAVIVLGVQADTTNALGEELDNIEKRVSINETNILSAINVANQAYSKADDTSVSNQVMSDKVDNALNVVGKVELDMENLENQVSNSSLISTQARAIAENAATAAESMRKEAIDSANDAVSKVGELTKTLEPLTTWEDPATGNSGASYLVTYINNGLATKAEIETVEDDLGHATSAIQQNAKSLQSLVISIDKYSVGEYSQANGLTQEQATNILEDGLIYVPTKQHEESSYSEESPRTFTPGYLYQWGELSSGLHGWTTVDKDYGPTTESEGDAHDEINTSSMAVYFSHVEIMIGGNNNYGYWYTDGDEIESVSGATYEPYTLYKWETDHWFAVATLKGNVNNRATSQIRQTANEIALEITNAYGSVAGFGTKLTETDSAVSMLSSWKNGDGEVNEAIIRQKTEDGVASIVISTLQGEPGNKVESASLVLNATRNKDDTATLLTIGADNINLNGVVTANDNVIIDTEGRITAVNANITGKITATEGYIGDEVNGFEIKDNAMRNVVQYDSGQTDIINPVSAYMTSYNKLEYGSTYLYECVDKNFIYVGTDGIGLMHTASYTENQAENKRAACKQTWMANGQFFSNSGTIGGWEITADGLRNTGETSGTIISDGKDSETSIKYGSIINRSITEDGVYSRYNMSEFNAGTQSFKRIYDGEVRRATIGWNMAGESKDPVTGNYTIPFQVEADSMICGTHYSYGQLWGTWILDSGAAVTSWRGAKHDIESLDDRYSILFDNLNPVRFKYNDGQSDRYHTGFILDELKDAMAFSGVDSSEFAAYCVNDEQTGEGGIRYEEIIALLVKEVQELKKEIKEIKGNE